AVEGAPLTRSPTTRKIPRHLTNHRDELLYRPYREQQLSHEPVVEAEAEGEKPYVKVNPGEEAGDAYEADLYETEDVIEEEQALNGHVYQPAHRDYEREEGYD